jgi:hypothetical protein
VGVILGIRRLHYNYIVLVTEDEKVEVGGAIIRGINL